MVAVNFLSLLKKIFFILVLLSVLHARPWAESVTISLVGDIIINENMMLTKKQSASRNNRKIYNDFFSGIRGNFVGSDMVIGNLEFPIRFPYKTSGYRFNCPPEIVPVLKHAGFSILSIANNHIMDQGPGGLFATIDVLDSRGIEHVGAGKREGKFTRGIIKNIRGIKTGIISYTSLLNVKPTRKSKNYYINWLYNRPQVN